MREFDAIAGGSTGAVAAQEIEQLRLVPDLDSQRLGPCQLGARAGAGDHDVGARADAAGHPARRDARAVRRPLRASSSPACRSAPPSCRPAAPRPRVSPPPATRCRPAAVARSARGSPAPRGTRPRVPRPPAPRPAPAAALRRRPPAAPPACRSAAPARAPWPRRPRACRARRESARKSWSGCARSRRAACAPISRPCAPAAPVSLRRARRCRRHCAPGPGRPAVRSASRPAPRCPARDARRSGGSSPSAARRTPGRPEQRATASPSPCSTGEPHTGQRAGSAIARASGGRRSSTTRTTCGITSPARRTITVSPSHHAEAPHLVHVVQRGVADRDAADEHRRQPRHRRDRPGAPDLELDVEQRGHFLLRRELVRDRPARRARDEAEPLLQRHAVDLEHDAVDVVAQRGAPLLQLARNIPGTPRHRVRRAARDWCGCRARAATPSSPTAWPGPRRRPARPARRRRTPADAAR